MPDLKFNTEDMRGSADKYREIANDLESVKLDLKNQITDLKAVYWRSEAGDSFMAMYEDTWASNVDKYTAVLREMAGILDRAARDYDDITRKIKTIPEVHG